MIQRTVIIFSVFSPTLDLHTIATRRVSNLESLKHVKLVNFLLFQNKFIEYYFSNHIEFYSDFDKCLNSAVREAILQKTLVRNRQIAKEGFSNYKHNPSLESHIEFRRKWFMLEGLFDKQKRQLSYLLRINHSGYSYCICLKNC